MVWLALVTLFIVCVGGYISRHHAAATTLERLRAHGWHPGDGVVERARATLTRQQTLIFAGAGVGGVVALVLLDRTLSVEGRHGWAFGGAAVGATLGSVVGHLSSGRVPRGPRVAEATARQLHRYLSRWQVVALGLWVVALLIATPWAVSSLVAAQHPAPARGAVIALVLAAALWLALAAIMMTRVLRHRSAAVDEDDLVWQEWMRATVLKDLADSMWFCVCAVVGALWASLVSGAATQIALELAGWLTALAVAGLFASWIARTTLPPVVKKVLAC